MRGRNFQGLPEWRHVTQAPVSAKLTLQLASNAMLRHLLIEAAQAASKSRLVEN
jgi:hypothetical protein